MKYNECIDILSEWYDSNHGGCEDTTCTMAECDNQGLVVVKIKLLGDAIFLDDSHSKEIEAFSLLNGKFKKRYKKDFSEELNILEKVSHAECSNCEAIIWQPEFCDNYCSSCGK